MSNYENKLKEENKTSYCLKMFKNIERFTRLDFLIFKDPWRMFLGFLDFQSRA